MNTGRRPCGDRGRGCSNTATSPGSTHRRHHQEPEEAWGRFSPGASRRNQPYLGFELLASRYRFLPCRPPALGRLSGFRTGRCEMCGSRGGRKGPMSFGAWQRQVRCINREIVGRGRGTRPCWSHTCHFQDCSPRCSQTQL